MSGGGGGMIEAISKTGATNSQAQSGMPAYGSKTTSPSANRYTPTYAPMQQAPQQAPQQNIQDMGLQALYQSIYNQYAPISQQFNPMDQFYQKPMQQQMPAYQNPALNYRPDMAGITTNLNRVTPSVQEQQKLAAIEEARRVAKQATNASSFSSTYDYGQAG